MKFIRIMKGIRETVSYHKGFGRILFAIKYNLGLAKEGVDFWTEGATEDDSEFLEKYQAGRAREGIDFITY